MHCTKTLVCPLCRFSVKCAPEVFRRRNQIQLWPLATPGHRGNIKYHIQIIVSSGEQRACSCRKIRYVSQLQVILQAGAAESHNFKSAWADRAP